MLRTALACVLAVMLAFASARWLTHDYQVWTAEGARRLNVALNPVAAPNVVMDVAGLERQTLDELLADGRSATIVNFVYTRCITVCSALGGVFQRVQAEIFNSGTNVVRAPVKLLSISFDPANDNPTTLQRYASGLSADPRIWRFARVADPADAQRLLDRYGVVVIPDGLGGYEHNAALLVTDPAGRLLRVFDYAEPEIALAYARSVAEQAGP